MNPSELEQSLLSCSPGQYPWDLWEKRALTAGLSVQLAALGRSVMREAFQHDWHPDLKYQCGITEDEAATALLAFAKAQPVLIAERWQWLLATDGLRVDPWEHEHYPEDSPLWDSFYRRWVKENPPSESQESAPLRQARDAIAFYLDVDQLALIDIETVFIGPGTLYADFHVIENRRITHSGIVRIKGGDAEVFKQVEEV